MYAPMPQKIPLSSFVREQDFDHLSLMCFGLFWSNHVTVCMYTYTHTYTNMYHTYMYLDVIIMHSNFK